MNSDPGDGMEEDNRVQEQREGKRGRFFPFFLGVLVGTLVMSIISSVIIARMRQILAANAFQTPAAAQTEQAGGDGQAGGSAAGSTGSAIDGNLGAKLQLLERYIRQFYLDSDEVTAQKLQDGMYKGLLEALDDPYSVYYTAEEYKALNEQTTGTYEGIGATLQKGETTGMPEIVGIFKGAPAEKAGVRVGDIIYQVDDMLVTSDMELTDVTMKIRGEAGTSVHITFYRKGEPVEIDIVREKVDTPTVTSEVLEDGMGYLAISEFDDVTVQQFETEMKNLRDQGIKGLILDLRGNPGGNVTTVNAIAEQILPAGRIFYMEDRDGNRTEYTCKGADFDLPMTVLVNGGSASAAEILSGAIQDAGIGTLIGTQTFGKGIVQTIYPLEDGTAVKITVAGYFTRGGRDIHKVGIKPDIEIEFDSDTYYDGDGTDNQLEKAKEVLRTMMK